MRSSRLTIGVSLKMYLGQHETASWCDEAARIARDHPSLRDGSVELFVLPTFPLIADAIERFENAPVHVGAQDLWTEDRGPFTGEVSGAVLRELGCTHVAIGHAERRDLFDEDHLVSAKLAAAFRNQLTPVLCVGEQSDGGPEEAADRCVEQVGAALDGCQPPDGSRLVIAYEPVWAIGQAEPAPPARTRIVVDLLAEWLGARYPELDCSVIYGGSAGDGLLGQLSGSIDGLFLGRSVHDPAVLGAILDEATKEMANR